MFLTWLGVPSVNRNPAPRSASNLSFSPLSFIRKLWTNVFSINYCNQSAATFTGQENTSATARRPDDHDSHLSNVLSLPITNSTPPTSAASYKYMAACRPFKETAMRNEIMKEVDPTENLMVTQSCKTVPCTRTIKTGVGIAQEPCEAEE